VTIVVNTGDESDATTVEVPDVTGMSVDEARDTLEDEGLRVGNVQGSGEGQVVAMFPLAGTEVDPDSEVTLWAF
jgi:beta-lactam-binding protein with PASTA domain